MAVFEITQGAGGLESVKWPHQEPGAALWPMLQNCAEDKPVTIYVHGHTDWPHPQLLDEARRSDRLAIRYLWSGRRSPMGAVLQASRLYHQAATAADGLRDLLLLLAQFDAEARFSGRNIDLMCHSLGTRVALGAIAKLSRPIASRVISFAGAEFCPPTLAAVSSKGARGVAFVNVTTDQQSLFHRTLHRVGPRCGPKDRLISAGFAFPRPNWVDINLDVPVVRGTIGALCAEFGSVEPQMPAPAAGFPQGLAAQLGGALSGLPAMGTVSHLRDVLGEATQSPLTMIPLRTPHRRRVAGG